VYVPPDDDVVPDEPVDAVEPPDDELVDRGLVVVRRGAVLDGAGPASAGACACSSADIESRVGLGEIDSALSTGVVSVLLHATVAAASSAAATTITFFMVLPAWVKYQPG